MKHFRTIAILWGFFVVLVMPVLLVISRLNEYKLLTFQEYVIYLLMFLVMYFMIRDEEKTTRQRDAGS